MNRGPYKANDPLGRRPWADVAREFTRRTGLPISEQGANRACARAERKVRAALERVPEVAAVVAEGGAG